MDIFHLSRCIELGRTSYNQLVEAVVIAAGEEHARRIASVDHHDEGPEVWFGPSVTVTWLGETPAEFARARVVCADVNEGLTEWSADGVLD